MDETAHVPHVARVDFSSFGSTNYGVKKNVGLSSRVKHVLEGKSSAFRSRKS